MQLALGKLEFHMGLLPVLLLALSSIGIMYLLSENQKIRIVLGTIRTTEISIMSKVREIITMCEIDVRSRLKKYESKK